MQTAIHWAGMRKLWPEWGLFVTGTGTEVGKTFVGALIARTLRQQGIRVGVYKPVASGCEVDGAGHCVASDAVALWQAAGAPGSLQDVCPQRFVAPLAPPRAAAQEGKAVDAKLLRDGLQVWRDRCDIVLVEGAGGLMSPLSDEDYNADLALDFGYPLLVVAPNRLGVINDTLQTLITAATFSDGLPVAGVVLNHLAAHNDDSLASNRQELEARCVPPVLGAVPLHAQEFPAGIDWLQLARTVR